MMDAEYFFYMIMSFVYRNHSMLLSLAYAVPAILILHRFMQRKPFSRGGAMFVAIFHLILAGAVRYAEVAYGVERLVASLLTVVACSVAIYFVLSLDPKKNKNVVKRTVSQVFPDAKPGMGIQSPWEIVAPRKPAAPPASSAVGRPAYDRPVIPRSDGHANEAFHRDTAWNASTFCCQSCGATLLNRSRFCYKCGAVIDGEPDVILNGQTVKRDDI